MAERREITLGIRGKLIVYMDGTDIKIKNESSCHLLIDDEIILYPGQVV